MILQYEHSTSYNDNTCIHYYMWHICIVHDEDDHYHSQIVIASKYILKIDFAFCAYDANVFWKRAKNVCFYMKSLLYIFFTFTSKSVG